MINAIVGIFLIIAFLGYDVHLALDGVPGNTWSEIARKFGTISTVLPFIWGILAGHFFHPDSLRSPFNPTSGFLLLLWVTLFVGLVGILCRSFWHSVPPWLPLVPGFVAGWLLWPSGG